MSKSELFKMRSAGGKARAKKLSKERRIEIARAAGKANLGKKKTVNEIVKQHFAKKRKK